MLIRERVKILLIDDDVTDRELFTQAVKLGNTPNIVMEASSGKAAIEMLEKCDNNFPHFIFLDLNLPMMDGREILRYIKASDQLRSVPVFIMSTSASQMDVDNCYKTGVNLFLEKPGDFTDMIQMVECILTLFYKSVKRPRIC